MSCIEQVKTIMLDGKYHALGQLAKRTGYGETTIAAQIRKLRRDGFSVELKRDNRARGFSYRLVAAAGLFQSQTSRKCVCAHCAGRGFKYGRGI